MTSGNRSRVTQRNRAIGAAFGALLLGAAAGTSSCLTGLDGTQINACASQEIFETSVSTFMERRCGTLDCHGGIARPMRLYGERGLRHPTEDNVSGTGATTSAELTANYTSVCNLEPEKMNDAVANFGNNADELLLLRKARGLEKHKGGTVVNANDHGDSCLKLWLQGNEAGAADECGAAVDQL